PRAFAAPSGVWNFSTVMVAISLVLLRGIVSAGEPPRANAMPEKMRRNPRRSRPSLSVGPEIQAVAVRWSGALGLHLYSTPRFGPVSATARTGIHEATDWRRTGL